MKQGYFKTGKRLQIAIDNAHRIEGMRFYLASQWAYMNLDQDGFKSLDEIPAHGDLIEIPYWCTEGAIDFAYTSDNPTPWESADYDEMTAQLIHGYYDPYSYGDTLMVNGLPYTYFVSVGLGGESEYQALNGECAYLSEQESFLRILIPLFSELN